MALTPTSKISLKRVVNSITEKLLALENGSETYDCFSGQVEKVKCVLNVYCILVTFIDLQVKIPIACMMADLAAKG